MRISVSLLKLGLITFLGVCVLFIYTQSASAQTSFTSIKDTITTSRPSASSPVNADVSPGATQITVYDNGSFYLASDSAKILPDVGETIDTGLIVTSMSDQGATLNVTLANSVSNSHHNGNPLILPVTAVHTIEMTLNQGIPATGDIVITFPGGADSSASPSASTFAFNGLIDTDISTNNVACGSIIVFSPTITCSNILGSVSGGVTVTILIGCTAQSGGSCTTEKPLLINPTKSAAAGTSDSWSVTVLSRDGADAPLDSSTISVNTIESVTVQATVDPSLTFTITSLTSGDAANLGNATGCDMIETMNAGSSANPALVNFGSVAATPTTDIKLGDIAGQRINITTNASNGYVLSATASGSLFNPANGVFFAANTSPQSFPDQSDFFGLHACGLDVTPATWTESGTENCSTHVTGSAAEECMYAWPSVNAAPSSSALTIASDSTGPIGNTVVTGNGIVSLVYAAGTDALVPAGTYRSIITYIATPTF